MDNFIANNRRNTFGTAQNGNSSQSEIELVTTRKAKPDFDINRELANRTFIRPLPPKGHIVKSNLLSAPMNFMQEVRTDFKALKSAWSGDANDHQLGKLNDLGMKLGGLAIASYLFTLKKAPVTKAMEFVGLGSFFASMSLWPKIALDIPARLIHGFSPFMRYEDSQGRKKGFFQDNQYIPFDMLKEKDIDRIGNRLHVPKDLPNRREAIEERMRQIALQNNTMWMLTAGFATPIMSSLICNRLEPYVEDIHNKRLNKKIESLLTGLSEQSKKFVSPEIEKGVNDVLTLHNNEPITDAVLEDIAKALTIELNPNVRNGVKKDLEKMFIGEEVKYRIQPDEIKNIYNTINTLLKDAVGNKILKENLELIIPTEVQLNTLFAQNGYFDKPLNDIEIGNILSDINAQLYENIKNATGVVVDDNLKRKMSRALRNTSENSGKMTLTGVLKANSAAVLDANAQKIIRDAAQVMTKFCAENAALNVYSFNKLAQAPNTIKAKYWNDTIDALVDILKISPKEIEETRYDRKLVGELFNKKIWNLALSKDGSYEKFVQEFAHKVSENEKTVNSDNLTNKFMKKVDNTFESASNAFKEKGFIHTAQRLVGVNSSEAGSLKGMTKTFVKDNLSNLQNTMSAILNKANVFRTIANDPEFKFISGDDKVMPREIREELTALAEYLTTEGRISDYSVKFDFIRNPHPNMEDISPLDFENGEIKYKYYNAKNLQKDGTIIKSDESFFRNIMKTLFNTELNKDTENALSKYSGVKNMLNSYRSNMYNIVGNMENFMYPTHITGELKYYGDGRLDPASYTSSTPKFRSNTVGAPIDETLANTMKRMYNTRKWLKMFGGFGAGLLGFTVISQFFFGHSSGNYKKDKA